MTSDKGLLGFNGLPITQVRGPTNVWLDGDYICWDPDDRTLPDAVSSEGLLDAFVRLRSPGDVLRFVRTWGAIGFCQAHGLPTGHQGYRYSAFEWYDAWELESGECFPDASHSRNCDPVERYLHFASRAAAILRLAVDAHEGRTGSREDWLLALTAFFPEEDWNDEAVFTSYMHNGTLGDLISEWLRVGRVHPELEWYSGEPKFTLLADTFGVVGVQMLQAVSRTHGVAICSSCAMPYLRQGRKPQAGRRNYCPDCGEKAWLRDAQKDYQSRRRTNGKTSSE